MKVGDVLDDHRLVVCVGTGGVGKTTLAAAIGLGAALRGRRAMVLTIDPAHQLGRALGHEGLGSEPEPIPGERLREAGLDPKGTLDAAMLDQKGAWDAFIERHAPSAELRDQMLGNPFYQRLTASFAGATEYAAMEELCRLSESGRYDLIVLDTPPTGGALGFLRAPGRLDQLLLDRDVVGWLARPFAGVGRGAWRGVTGALRTIVRRLERATGGQTLREISSFFVALEALLSSIQRRTAEVRSLLHAPETAFVLVAGPNEQVLEETRGLQEEIDALGAPIRAVVLNRVHLLPEGGAPPADVRALLDTLRAAGADQDTVDWLDRTYGLARDMERAELTRWDRFAESLPPDMARTRVPEGDRDMHSLADLATVAEHLWNGE